MKVLIGRKLGMTTLFDTEKGALNMTLIECVPNEVAFKRTTEKDGYQAVALKTQKTKKRTMVREFRIDSKQRILNKEANQSAYEALELGQKLDVEQFSLGDKVHISGVTKAKGFQGVVKRYNFAGGRASHGGKHDLRKPGSIGSGFPEHVLKGKRMAGRMGGENFTVQNLTVVYIDAEKQLLGVRGAVPGVSGRMITITGAN